MTRVNKRHTKRPVGSAFNASALTSFPGHHRLTAAAAAASSSSDITSHSALQLVSASARLSGSTWTELDWIGVASYQCLPTDADDAVQSPMRTGESAARHTSGLDGVV